YRFTMKKLGERKFAWKLEGKPKGGDDAAYRVVLAGGILRGAEKNRGRGKLGIDGDALAAIDPALKVRGKLLTGFWHGTRGAKSLAYALKEFTPDVEQHQPVSALFRALRGPNGGTLVRFAVRANVGGSPDPATKELLIARVRWLPGVGGRADAVALQGDVPADHVYVSNACWNAQLQSGFHLVRDWDKTQQKFVAELKREGDLNACKAALGGEQRPSEDPLADDGATDEEVESEDAPPSMPSGDGL
ncbi:MAG: hypothetical protein ACK4N5_03090, partial [Myxococcales bacterium]